MVSWVSVGYYLADINQRNTLNLTGTRPKSHCMNGIRIDFNAKQPMVHNVIYNENHQSVYCLSSRCIASKPTNEKAEENGSACAHRAHSALPHSVMRQWE